MPRITLSRSESSTMQLAAETVAIKTTTRSQNQACMYLADDNGINARKQKQKSQLSQRDSAILPVNEYFAKSLKAI